MSMRQFISPLVGEMVGRPEGVRATHEALKKNAPHRVRGANDLCCRPG